MKANMFSQFLVAVTLTVEEEERISLLEWERETLRTMGCPEDELPVGI